LLLYGYCVGVFSGRKIQQRIAEDIAFRVLAAGNEPDFRTISDFRKIHLETLKGFFEQVLKIALAAGASVWRWTGPKSRRTPANTRR
jgi:transposase